MTDSEATGYDCLTSRLVPEGELRTFLLDCFEIAEDELFVGHTERIADDLRAYPPDLTFAAFCTYDDQVSGHFAMSVSVGIEGRLAERVGRHEFAERLAASFDAYVLYGDTEPPGLWTVVLPDGSHLRAAMEEDEGTYVLDAATAPVPGLPTLRADEGLWLN
ncbi:hypothetical protein GCM10023085_27150 [Actinomadura viridis]|uniref:Uncharacterized protein n=1 Tax=Actinomadura viridis TaxID=58110 RepID=A0A931DET0_9ACTN|nr:hypothetical protein [Actinomadura viridis]MBG6087298.1 hypothetical protein [Actinomadura viridis]